METHFFDLKKKAMRNFTLRQVAEFGLIDL